MLPEGRQGVASGSPKLTVQNELITVVSRRSHVARFSIEGDLPSTALLPSGTCADHLKRGRPIDPCDRYTDTGLRQTGCVGKVIAPCL